MAVPGHGGEEAPAKGSAVTPTIAPGSRSYLQLTAFLNSLGTGPEFPLFFPAFATL